MRTLSRRSALALGLAGVAAAVVKPAASQTMDMTAGKDTTLAPGVVQRAYGESSAIIPGFKSVSMRDIIIQPGSKTGENPMKNAMVCHITDGEVRIVQDGKIIPAKKNHVWTCDKGTREQAFNDGRVVGIMRITDLIARASATAPLPGKLSRCTVDSHEPRAHQSRDVPNLGLPQPQARRRDGMLCDRCRPPGAGRAR